MTRYFTEASEEAKHLQVRAGREEAGVAGFEVPLDLGGRRVEGRFGRSAGLHEALAGEEQHDRGESGSAGSAQPVPDLSGWHRPLGHVHSHLLIDQRNRTTRTASGYRHGAGLTRAGCPTRPRPCTAW
jgi:hypothetical protein